MGRINEELGNVLQKALDLVSEMQQDIMTIEHVFYTLLQTPLGNELVRATGANTNNLLESIAEYLHKYIPKGRQLKDFDGPQQTPAFSRVFEHMISHAESANKSNIGIGDFFAACMQEESSYCVKLLHAQGIGKEDVIRVIVDFDESRHIKIKDSVTYLEKYAKNLNKLAREGKIDPLIGREHEIQQISQVLCRRKKNNPILIGEAGVGKSAIIEGLALRIVQGNVPKKCLIVLYTLSM